jgi:hypothetical protein
MNTSEMATCPFNPNHAFAKYKLFPHIQRCKDALRSNKKLLHCKKDIMIMFFKEDRELHYSSCKYCSSNDLVNNQTIYPEVEEVRQKKIELMKKYDQLKSINMDLSVTQLPDESFNYDFKHNDTIFDKSNFIDEFDLEAISNGTEAKEEKNQTILY